MADVASPYPAGDPRTATFNDQIATLEHQETTKLAEDEVARKEARIGEEQKIGEFNRLEPRSLQREAFTANAEGLAQSSTNAQRRGTVLSDYVAKRGAAARGLEKEEGKISRAEQGTRETGAQARKTASDRAIELYLTGLAKEKPEVPPRAAEVAAATPGAGAAQGYPKATAYVTTLFPNPGEQAAYSKMSPAQKAATDARLRAEGRL